MLNRSTPRVAVLASFRAPGVSELLEDPARGQRYELVACLTSEPRLAGSGQIEATGVPVITHPIRGLSLRNLTARRDYDEATAAILARFDVDIVLLTSYLYILTEPMVSTYRGRIINIHDSDLTILGEDGRPRYVGLHATRDAILAGERETRATAHFVTERVDEGPVILVSGGYPVSPLIAEALRWGAYDMVKAYAYAHREWVIRSAWGPLLRHALSQFLGVRRIHEAHPGQLR